MPYHSTMIFHRLWDFEIILKIINQTTIFLYSSIPWYNVLYHEQLHHDKDIKKDKI